MRTNKNPMCDRSQILCGLGVLAMCFGVIAACSVDKESAKETRISGQMKAADNGALHGIILIEKGRLYGKNYQYGGLVDRKGRFSVKVDGGGDYGLHVYATGYIYYPLGVQVEAGKDNEFDFTLPPNPAPDDSPVISQVRFDHSEGSQEALISLSVQDPNENLSHQVLGTNMQTQEGFIFNQPGIVLPWQRDYPNGVYTLSYDTKGRALDPEKWVFVAADNRCYNSKVLGHPFSEDGILAAHAQVRPTEKEAEPRDESALELGRRTFEENCAICHFAVKEKPKVGPGLKGLFRLSRTPALNQPVTEEHILRQIQEGGNDMPPYPHIKGRALEGLIGYLKTL